MTYMKNKNLMKNLVITISGFHGSGRTTHAKKLAKALGLRYVSSGTIFRQMAEERNLSLEEMSILSEQDPQIDMLIDEKTKEESKRRGLVIDATLSAWMAIDPDIKIFLITPLKNRIIRIACREKISYNEAERETLAREESERERFLTYYDIDIADFSIYDVILNTDLFAPQATARILKRLVEEYCIIGN